MKEKDSIDMISKDTILKLKGLEEESNKKIRLELERLLRIFLDKASIKSWDYIHGMTVKANARRFVNEKSNGLYDSYSSKSRYSWDLLFNDAYIHVFSKATERFVKELSSTQKYHNKEKVEAVLINLREKFLGKNKELYEFKKGNSEVNKFRDLLDELYEKNELLKKSRCADTEDMGIAREYLIDICNFSKLFEEDKDAWNRLVLLYRDTLVEALEDDRKQSFENVITYTDDVESLLLDIVKESILKKENKERKNNKNKGIENVLREGILDVLTKKI